jgi:hypothetical protein
MEISRITARQTSVVVQCRHLAINHWCCHFTHHFLKYDDVSKQEAVWTDFIQVPSILYFCFFSRNCYTVILGLILFCLYDMTIVLWLCRIKSNQGCLFILYFYFTVFFLAFMYAVTVYIHDSFEWCCFVIDWNDKVIRLWIAILFVVTAVLIILVYMIYISYNA